MIVLSRATNDSTCVVLHSLQFPYIFLCGICPDVRAVVQLTENQGIYHDIDYVFIFDLPHIHLYVGMCNSKTKPISDSLPSCSPLHQLHIFALRFDWFTGLSESSFVIG